MENGGSYESSHPERYDQSLDLVAQYEDLPEGEDKENVFIRARALNLGTEPDRSDGIGMVEAIALSMQEREEQAVLDSQQTKEPDNIPVNKPTKPKVNGWAEYAAAKPREDNPTGPRFDEDGNRVVYPDWLT